jgi:hypothetical protein
MLPKEELAVEEKAQVPPYRLGFEGRGFAIWGEA